MRVLPGAVAPSRGVLKAYWERVHVEALEHLGNRPLTLVRHVGGQTFFHKGPFPVLPGSVHSFTMQKREGGEGTRVWVDDLDGLLGLVDIGTVEIHPWQARLPDFETADLMIFDLDPGDGIEPAFIRETALLLRNHLLAYGMNSWPKTSGGKGFHVMVPLAERYSHDEARIFAKALAQQFADHDDRYIVNSSPAKRHGRIFIDYLRNGRGTTAVGAYSPRARPGFPLSMPVERGDIENGVRPDAFTMAEA